MVIMYIKCLFFIYMKTDLFKYTLYNEDKNIINIVHIFITMLNCINY